MFKIIEDRHCVFISSTGRTGTQFLAKTMPEMINNCVSYHEPGTPWLTRPEEWPEQVKRFGLYHMTLGQLRSDHCMFKLSTERITNQLTEKKARLYLKKMRRDLINEAEDKIYIESSGHMYGVLDLLAEEFPNSKFIFIVRDPRTWVKSAMNTFEYILYGFIDISWLNISIKAKDIADDPYKDKWDDMSKYEKYCWFYNKLNSFVFEKMMPRRNFKVYRHEDIFNPRRRNVLFTNMLKFASSFRDGFSKRFKYKPKLMKKKVHSNKNKKKFPDWRRWNPEMARIMKEHCGYWMERFDYGKEKLWREKTG